MIERQELPVYVGELIASAAYAAFLQALDRRYEPDWTWLTVVGGVILSTTPAMLLARRLDGDWRAYERRTVAGFCTSGLIIIGWQLWQHARREGRAEGYALAYRTREHTDHADRKPPLE